ncbi:hypothetical protein DFH07DRAFT_815125 [Mycena maculata]|uniref:Uncharacterized protein n=1 Tax=Mycena maculata TaxID=230809 RepID=A0AAD7NIM6_9AGAR|nr:hypothetical protein DFH07DRAFT_815125 [Mycena maculata]
MLDPREPDEILEDPTTGACLLSFLPVVILPKLDGCSFELFHRLPQGILPVMPSQGTFCIFVKFGQKQLIIRLTAAYVFTDYKTQGQMMGHVLIDLENPPGGNQSKSMIRCLREMTSRYSPRTHFTTWRWKMIDCMQQTGIHAHIQICKFIVMLINSPYDYIDQRGVRCVNFIKLWTNGNTNTMAIVAEIPWQSCK